MNERTSVRRLGGHSARSRHRRNGSISVLGADSTAGNWAAAEAMTDPRMAQQLVANMTDVNGNLPELFELIVRAEFQSLVPIKIAYVTHKVIARKPTAK
jgi:hypothetical protein